ncbi:calmodulin-binding protein [Streptomyces sp. Je 1-4]|uniref:BP74-related protein n=1 Tax=Streptomyces TaxID=1883 RepID=UPI00140EBA83|nr:MULTISPECIES: calmodulin-binding protein [unclassified Streptomyces]QIK07930.1 calmodulin-binding protein [Streptomyces sp. ID38640]UYB41524.1 calmodulin-binding protein [Streptomyces sp. Je 1-4]UZQ37766.1 calmodulin-binding protein [Streptomyces sp. Je 1-4] [Streptomyces sp. Je 1-4 4N24]UZQ45183.1 calmodulin-binding protein [Streptomyces sp. Je 1-4] [Streptomyces sp. Je 1-4 4N24_ara]
MRRITTKIGILAAAALLAVTAAGPAQGKQASDAAQPHRVDSAAYFVMTDVTREEFVIKLTDPRKIQHARDLLSGATSSEPHVIGRIDKRPAPYNWRWSFHLRPETIDFFDFAIEVCDATTPYVEEHLDEAGGPFLPGLIWCPWSSKLLREVPQP